MRDILKRIFIGVAIGMALFFLKTEVFALTWDFTDVQEEVFVFNSAKTINKISNTGGQTNQIAQADFDTNYTNTNDYNFAVFPYTGSIDLYYYYFPNTDDTLYAQHSIQNWVNRVVLISSSGSWSTCELQNNLIVCPIKADFVYTGIRFYYNTPPNINYFSMTFTINNAMGLYNLIYSSAIQQQTEDIQNTDAPADNTYNNDYSTSSFDSASSSVNQHTNTDVSSLTLDSSNYSSSWSWLWTTLESFIANTKVFLAYIFMLTLGFIALVLGR